MEAIWSSEFTLKMESLAAHFKYSAADLTANRAGKMSPAQKRMVTISAIKSSLFGAIWTFYSVVILILFLSPDLLELWLFLFMEVVLGLLEYTYFKFAWRAWRVVKSGDAQVVMGKVFFQDIPNQLFPRFSLQYLLIRNMKFIIKPVDTKLFVRNAFYKVYYSRRDPQRLLSLELVYLF